MQYSYSFDEENYHGPFDSIEETLAEATANATEGRTHVWVGENRAPTMFFPDADDVIEHITNQDDFCIDQAEGWPNATQKQMDQLTAAIEATVNRWLTRNKLHPTFWLVESVKEYEIEDLDAIPPPVSDLAGEINQGSK